MNAEHARSAKTPSAKTGLFATLRGLLRTDGSRAPSSDGVGGRTPSLRLLGLLALTTAALLALFAAPAQAAEIRPQLFTFGGTGSGAGQFSQFSNVPSSPLAVDQSTGDVYVGDPGNNRVEKFGPSGALILMFGGEVDKTTGADVCTAASTDTCGPGTPDPSPSGNGHGFFGGGEGIAGLAVDQATGDVYATDRSAQLVERFDEDGTFLAQFTAPSDANVRGGNALAVDSSGNVYVADGSGCGCVQKFDSSGSPDPTTPQIGLGTLASAFSVAIDSSDNLYVADRDNHNVQKFDSSGALISSGNYASGLDNGNSPAAVAVDPATDDVYVLDDGLHSVLQYDASGNQLSNAPPPQSFELGSSRGIAFDTFNGDLFLTDGNHDTVGAFGPTAILPNATTGEATEITPTTATLNGIVNPAETEASYQFEYGTTSSYGQKSPVSPASVGNDNTDHPESTELTGLTPDTVYHFRIDAGNTEAAGINSGTDAIFRTTGPPTIDSVSPVSGITGVAATIEAQVNPSGFDTHFWVAYGTTPSYGSETAHQDVGESSEDQAVSAELSPLQATTIYHYRVFAENTEGTVESSEDRSFETEPSARIVDESVSVLEQTCATLEAKVNPDGSETLVRFEYGLEKGVYGSETAPAGIGASNEPQEASAEVCGLNAGTTYHFRAVATNSAGPPVKGQDRHFATVAAAPIDSVSATNVTATSADLNAEINPLGSETFYRFEYGTTISYGTSVPIPDEDIGSASEDVAVTQHIEGLSPNTTYHYRVVAHNPLGITTSPDHTFIFDTESPGSPPGSCPGNEALRTGPSVTLPDCRAYELVTSAQKNGALVGATLFAPPPAIADDGSRVIAISVQCFADASSCNGTRGTQGSPYAFSRTQSGWVTSALSPPATQFRANTPWGLSNAASGVALFSMPTPPENEDDFYARQPGGSFLDIGPIAPPSLGSQGLASSAALGASRTATADLSHLVYQMHPLWPFDAGAETSVLEYVGVGNEHPFLVGVSGERESSDLISQCGTALGGSANGVPVDALSAAGRTVYFTATQCSSGTGANAAIPVPANELYARIDGELPTARTVLISQRSVLDCALPACQSSQPRAAQFQGASADGSRVFFTDTQRLTDGAGQDPNESDSATGINGCRATSGPNGCNLYLYEAPQAEPPSGHNPIDLSAGDTSGGGPRVQGVMAISPDGSHVYFVAQGVLTEAPNEYGREAEAGENNLYAYERDAAHPEGHLAFISALPGADAEEFTQVGRPANVTPDGRFLVFVSHGRLTPDDGAESGAAQVFRYDAQTGELDRISIGERGFNDNGNATVADAAIVTARYEQTVPGRSDPTMSDDGSRIFFESPTGLTPQALNNVSIGSDVDGNPAYAENVYEYHDGHVFLISDGRDATASTSTPCEDLGDAAAASAVCLLGTDVSGDNVFFSTADPLVPQDTDSGVDFYDARIGGGFPPPGEESICARSESCHTSGTEEGAQGSPGTSSFAGPEEGPKHHRCARHLVKRHGRCVRKKRLRKHRRHHEHRRAGAHRGGQR